MVVDKCSTETKLQAILMVFVTLLTYVFDVFDIYDTNQVLWCSYNFNYCEHVLSEQIIHTCQNVTTPAHDRW